MYGANRYALARPSRPGPYVSPLSAHGIADLVGTHGKHGITVLPVGIVPPSERELERRNAHVHPQTWIARKQRDHRFGYDNAPPLEEGMEYFMQVRNVDLVHTAWLIDNHVSFRQ